MSQIKTKFIENDAVTDQKFLARNGQYVRGRNNANSADVNLFRLNSADEVEFAAIPKASGIPTSVDQLINLGFLKTFVDGARDPKQGCRVASTVNVPLSGGATLTIDGVVLANGNRVLLKDQTTASQNGIYVLSGVGTAYALTRSADANEDFEVTQGMSTVIAEGTTNVRRMFVLTTSDPITVDTSSLTFVEIPTSVAYTGGAGLSLTGVDFSVNVSTAAAVKDRTTKINGLDEVEALKAIKQTFTLDSTMVTNGYIDLSQIAADSSVSLLPVGGTMQREGADYTLNYTGGSGGKTRLTFAGDLASAGAAAAAVGDVYVVAYKYL